MRIARKPRIAVVYDSGSASPTQIAKGLRDVASIVFVVARSAHVQSVMPLLEQFGEVEQLDEALASGVAAWSADGIVTFSERLLPAAARLAELLDLPQHTPDCASALTDKALQRRLLADSGVDTVRFATAGSPRSLAAALAEIGQPAVVKPQRGEGSSHTYLVRDQEEGHRLTESFERQWPVAGTGPLVLIVEEYLPGAPVRPGIGDFISVESATQDGRTRHIAVTGKFPLAPPFRETGNFLPPAIGSGEIEEIRSLATRALAALGVRSGITHTEIKLATGGPRIIEINGRLGGGIAELAQWVGGCDLITVAGRIALGETDHIPSLCPPGVHFQYHHASPREALRVSWIDGHRAVGALDGIYRYSRVTLPAEVSGVSTAWFDTLLGTADTYAQMTQTLEKAGEALEFGFEFQDGIHIFSGAELQRRARART